MSLEGKSTTIFSTSIYVGNYGGSISELVAESQEQRKRSKGLNQSNIGGWHSEYFDGNVIQSHIQDDIKKVCSEWGITDNLVVGNCWYNINTSKNYNHPHTHPGSILSGVIYLQCPLNCSPIVFTNPNHLLISSYINNLFEFTHGPNLSFQYTKFPKVGDLVLFPSWVEHYVPMSDYEGERITLSFNILRTVTTL